MSKLAVAWVPEGLTVVVNSLESDKKNKSGFNSINILPFYKKDEYDFFIASYENYSFNNMNFEEFVRYLFEEFQNYCNEHCSQIFFCNFIDYLYKILIESNKSTMFLNEMIVAGYDLKINKEVVIVYKIKQNKNSSSNFNLDYEELNGYRLKEAQLDLLNKDINSYDDKHLYGIYISGEDNNYDKKMLNDEYSKLKLKEVKQKCNDEINKNMKVKLAMTYTIKNKNKVK